MECRTPRCILPQSLHGFLNVHSSHLWLRHISPPDLWQVRAFLGLAGYYRCFIPNFSSLASPLTDLTRKGLPEKVPWGPEEEEAFQQVKTALTSEPILQAPCDGCPERSLPSPWKPTRITCTSSSRACRAHLRLVTAGLDKPPQHTRWWDMSPEDSMLTLDLHLFQKAAFDRPAPAHEHGTEDSHWKARAQIFRGAQSTNPRQREVCTPGNLQ